MIKLDNQIIAAVVAATPHSIIEVMDQAPMAIEGRFIASVVQGDPELKLNLTGGPVTLDIPGFKRNTEGSGLINNKGFTVFRAGQNIPVPFMNPASYTYTSMSASIWYATGKWEGICHPQFMEDAKAKLLRFNKILDPKRLWTYTQQNFARGYRYAPGEDAKMFALTLLSSELGSYVPWREEEVAAAVLKAWGQALDLTMSTTGAPNNEVFDRAIATLQDRQRPARARRPIELPDTQTIVTDPVDPRRAQVIRTPHRQPDRWPTWDATPIAVGGLTTEQVELEAPPIRTVGRPNYNTVGRDPVLPEGYLETRAPLDLYTAHQNFAAQLGLNPAGLQLPRQEALLTTEPREEFEEAFDRIYPPR